jgi:hypothetical protein
MIPGKQTCLWHMTYTLFQALDVVFQKYPGERKNQINKTYEKPQARGKKCC